VNTLRERRTRRDRRRVASRPLLGLEPVHTFDQENGSVPAPRTDVFDRQAHLTQPERVGGFLPLDG
jgi:hypothetical protein